MKDLTVSQIDRSNILNNSFAINELYENLGFVGIMFENQFRFTHHVVSNYFDIDERTIDRYLSQYSDELLKNGHEVLTGTRLKQFKNLKVTDINVANLVETNNQGINKYAPSK